MKKGKKNFVYDNFKLSLKYIKENKNYVLFSIVLFFVFFLFSYFGVLGVFSEELEKSLESHFSKTIQEIVDQTKNLSILDLITFIISNNIITSFIGMLSGIFLSVFSILILVFNGYLLGFAAKMVVNSPENYIGILILWRLFPHGIFEIPAVLISIGLGIKLGLYPFYVKDKRKGFLSLLVSFFIFFIISGIFGSILSLFSPGNSLESVTQKEISSYITNNSFISFVFYLSVIISFFVSFLIGIKILPDKDRIVVEKNFKNSIKVFVFVIIPLLVIAGIIEGTLATII